MTNGWQTVSLGEFLTERKEFFTIDDFSKYKRARVQSHGKGIVLRDEIDGIEIKTKKQQAARTGEFLVAEIDAKVGGFGIVPSELDGAIVSSHYFLFHVNEKKCSKEWLNWFVRYNSLEDQVKAQGSTNYAAIRPSHVLNFQIPLPSLDEQHRIIKHIQALSAHLAKAQFLRKEADTEVGAVLAAAMSKVFDFSGADACLGDYVTVISGYGFPSGEYVESGSHQILRIGNVRDGYLDLSRSPIYWNFDGDKRIGKVELQEGDIVISMTGTRNKRDYGYVAIVPAKSKLLLNQRLGKIIPKADIDTKYLYYFLRSPFFKDRLFPQAKGTANQANISNNHIESIQFGDLPPLDEQRRIVAYLASVQARLASLRELQSATREELDALLPSVLDRAFKGEL